MQDHINTASITQLKLRVYSSRSQLFYLTVFGEDTQEISSPNTVTVKRVLMGMTDRKLYHFNVINHINLNALCIWKSYLTK